MREYGDYLKDILDATDETATFTEGMSFEAFAQDHYLFCTTRPRGRDQRTQHAPSSEVREGPGEPCPS